jgi:D-3-phosphoglycerate dehydrogenase
VVGTLVGHRNRPHLLEAWGQRFNLQLDENLALFRNSDVPGMIGRVGTLLGERGINIAQMVVGRPEGHSDADAVMVLTTDAPMPREVLDEVVALDGFVEGRAVSLN